MSARIRYTKLHTGALLSTRNYSAGLNTYSVKIEPGDLSFMISNTSTSTIVATGEAKSLATLKSRAKKALANLGVEFQEENRNNKVA